MKPDRAKHRYNVSGVPPNVPPVEISPSPGSFLCRQDFHRAGSFCVGQGGIHSTYLSALVADRTMEAWYHPHCMNDPRPEGHMASHIRRRKFLATLGAAAAWPLAAVKLPRRNFLHLAAGSAALPALSRIAWARRGRHHGAQWLSERLRQPFVIENRRSDRPRHQHGCKHDGLILDELGPIIGHSSHRGHNLDLYTTFELSNIAHAPRWLLKARLSRWR